MKEFKNYIIENEIECMRKGNDLITILNFEQLHKFGHLFENKNVVILRPDYVRAKIENVFKG